MLKSPPMRFPAKDRLVALWHRAVEEHARPREVGIAVGLGLFACCSPILGFHSFIAVGLATLFRVNRLWALVFSQASIFGLLRAPIMFSEIQIGHHVRAGAWLSIPLRQIMSQAPSLFLDWTIGCIPVGGGISILGGLVAYEVARRRPVQASVTPGTPLPPRAPSSESTP